MNDREWQKDPRTWELVQMIVELRDMLPAITLASAKLRGFDLGITDRVERLLKPWEVSDDTPGAI